jgi:CheY-like chemotaxis protein
MGKKILTEAGYEVVAVSNGAAAVKKIAEQKPDIIILDVYMPGYTGLEVCEKVRGSMETLKTPVLLTVGKMEPYKPEEANRVRADGVIVKPFEASDLLAIVKKFEERIGQAAAAPGRSMGADAFQDSSDAHLDHPEPTIVAKIPQATVEVPDHMATTSAFSDLLSADPSHSLGQFNANKPGTTREVAPKSPANSAPIPDYELPVSWRKDSDLIAPSTMSAGDVVIETPVPPPPPPTPLRPRQIPVYEDGRETRSGMEVVPTAAPPTGEIDIPRDPQLQQTAAEATRNTVADSREPGLVPTLQPATEAGAASALGDVALAPAEKPASSNTEQAGPHAVENENRELPPGPRLVARAFNTDPVELTKLSESDFEARVAKAMAAYNQTASPQPVADPGGENAPAAENESSAGRASHPPATAKPAVPQAEPAKTTASNPTTRLATQLDAAVGAQTGSDHSTIAEAVHRVMERLKPELVEEIVKELKSKK